MFLLRLPFRISLRHVYYFIAFSMFLAATALAQQCPQDPSADSPAAHAYAENNLTEAERLYRADFDSTHSSKAVAGLARTLLHQGKYADVTQLLQGYLQQHPQDPAALTVLGELQFRQGDLRAAVTSINTAAAAPCNAIARFDAYRILYSMGRFASAYGQLQIAHAMATNDPHIENAWESTKPEAEQEAQLMTELKARVNDKSLSDDKRARTNEALQALETHQHDHCEAVNEVDSATIPLLPVQTGPQDPVSGVGMRIGFNGHSELIQVDTGASGITIFSDSLALLGLKPQLKFSAGGIGDERASTAHIAHVDSIRIGKMEFRNCDVDIVDAKFPQHASSGLIGTDVFSTYLVTVDMPSSRIQLSPLPVRPGETPSHKYLTIDGGDAVNSYDPAAAPRDRVLTPQTKDWTPILRNNHMLLVPTSLNGGPQKFFILDTGAYSNLIGVNAAREVTKVGKSEDEIYGLSGKVKQSYTADSITLQFGAVRKHVIWANSIDTTRISNFTGVDIAGFIGYDTLRDLVISIDYHDNLLHIVYDPNHGIHSNVDTHSPLD